MGEMTEREIAELSDAALKRALSATQASQGVQRQAEAVQGQSSSSQNRPKALPTLTKSARFFLN
jgi:hypothetical protein